MLSCLFSCISLYHKNKTKTKSNVKFKSKSRVVRIATKRTGTNFWPLPLLINNTANPEICGVKIFLDASKNPKIKNTKITCSEIIGVFNFGQTLASENFFTRKFLTQKFLDTKIFGFTVGTCKCLIIAEVHG